MSFATTRPKVKEQLRIPAAITQHDALIDALLDAADRAIMSWCNLPGLSLQTYSEVLDVEFPTEDQIVLSARPIATVAAVTNDGSLVDPSEWYLPKAGRIGRIALKGTNAWFTMGKQTVSVTYTAGWSTAPADVELAANILIANYFNRVPHMGFDAENVDGYDYKMSASDFPKDAQHLLSAYRRIM